MTDAPRLADPSSDPINILLVDDQPAKLLSYEVILAELGETLVKATSAREALEHLLRTEFAVVLIDVCMPELNGFELAQMIREHPRFQRLAIIFVSAVQIADPDMLRGYEAGAVDYVPVPVVPQLLRAKVKVFAELYRKTRELERLNKDLENRVAERTAALRRLNDELEARIEQRTREREQALAQLFEAQKLDTIGQLTGGVAHDFNNLLMAVTGSLELLRKRLPDDPRTARLIDNAMQGAARGAALTQRLLAFARRQELKPETVNVPQLVDGIQDLLSRALGPSIRLNQNFPEGLWDVRVDSNQLELALLNLAVNARDAMPFGGSLTIAAQGETMIAGSTPASLPPGEYLCIAVSDTGTGMDETTVAKAAEPFFTTKGPGKGTGLGLSMVHGLAAQSNGALGIESKLGEGTTIKLWLPRAVDRLEASAAPRPEIGSSKNAAPQVVLLVDDDPLVCAGTAEMLQDLGHHVIDTPSAAEAIEILKGDRQIDLVITDFAMPLMNGIELAKKIQILRPRLQVILASGYAELPDSNPEEAFPIALRLAKPYSQGDLALAIASLHSKLVDAQNLVPMRAG